MSTKYQWLQATLFCRRSYPSNNVLTLTGLVKSSTSRLRTQRAVIPAGWKTSSSHSFKATGTLVRLLVTLSLLFYYIFAVATTASATVSINEVYPAPDANNTEWVELYNDSDSETLLTGWKLEDQLTTPSEIMTLSNLALQPFEYVQISWQSNKLNNSADGITLYDASNQIVDSFSYQNSQTGKSWSKIGTQPNQEWQLTTPTPGEANLVQSEPSPTPLPKPCTEASPTPSASPTALPSPTSNSAQPFDIYISSVMSCPNESQPEWIEVFNTTAKTLSTEGWYVLDAANNKRYLLANSERAMLAATNFTTITFASAFINNSGETLFLYTSDDQLVQTIDLPSCSNKGIAFTQVNGEWAQEKKQDTSNQSEVRTETTTNQTAPTPATSKNQIVAESKTATPSVLGIQKRLSFQKPKLDIAEEVTNIFKDPVSLLTKEQQQTPIQEIFSFIIGGILISASTGYKLFKNMSILI